MYSKILLVEVGLLLMVCRLTGIQIRLIWSNYVLVYVEASLALNNILPFLFPLKEHSGRVNKLYSIKSETAQASGCLMQNLTGIILYYIHIPHCRMILK